MHGEKETPKLFLVRAFQLFVGRTSAGDVCIVHPEPRASDFKSHLKTLGAFSFLPSENGRRSVTCFPPPSFLHTIQIAIREPLYYHTW